jgi:hypothetical protein
MVIASAIVTTLIMNSLGLILKIKKILLETHLRRSMINPE